MTQAQHTQGPWEVMAHENGSFTVFEGGHAKNWADWSIAELNFTVQDKANAQLIACAPELLEALEILLQETMYKDHPAASERALKVIAKAKGES